MANRKVLYYVPFAVGEPPHQEIAAGYVHRDDHIKSKTDVDEIIKELESRLEDDDVKIVPLGFEKIGYIEE